jgi:pimeloyl-ACP methyl ester carboxylesterase
MSTNPITIDADGHQVTGISSAAAGGDLPLIVALPGGSYTSRYFDVPGHSLLDTAAANGVEVVALDRPGYGSSEPLDEVTFAGNATVLDAAIGKLWDERGGNRPGVVVIAHSIGGAIAVHLAAGHPAWPLLGIAISGIHDTAPDVVLNAWDAMPPGPVDFGPEQRRMFFYGPDWTIEDDIVERADISAALVPLEELKEVVGGWTREASSLAAQVTVPVQYFAVEFESLWTTTPETVQAFAGYFTSAPYVDSQLLPGLGHDADHHRAGQAFQLRQLAFALQCAEGVRRPA